MQDINDFNDKSVTTSNALKDKEKMLVINKYYVLIKVCL